MSHSIRTSLATAVLTLLRPLVRILLRNGVSYGAFAELAKKSFVDVADTEFQIQGKKQSVSHISALTGLTRKETKRLRELEKPEDNVSNERYNRAVRVISGWVNDPTYRNADGQADTLPLTGPNASFTALVKQYSGDVPTQAMLTVLETAGSIQRSGSNQVKLVRHAYVPGNDPIDKIHILGSDVSELLNTIDHNLTAGDSELHFQRKVSNASIDPAAIHAFKALSGEKAQSLLEELDDWLSKHEITGEAGKSDPRYLSMGIYFFERPSSEEVEDEHIENS